MDKYIEVKGKTIEAAIASALEQLGVDRDDVSVEVLENPKSGFLGIGSTDARVKVTYSVPDPEPEVVFESEAEVVPSAADISLSPKGQKLDEFLRGLLTRMGSDAVPVIDENKDGSFSVELTGRSLGALIGRRGETLDAIQHISNYVINHGSSSRVKVNIDVENYREKRRESLDRLAHKVAGKVVKYRKNVTLEPMNAYERHVIHAALQEYPDVTTYSTGTEPNRRIVVAYAREGYSTRS
ncbi:MAG: protein jag [Oscillospiraceae bacterium]|nr:protein jag [Oscillospiraceae bacterium]